MAQDNAPQLYLITPPDVTLSTFPDLLARMLDTVDIACLRLSLSSTDEDHVMRIADALRDVAHARDVALVLDSHVILVERLGLDGVHLTDGARGVRAARQALGADAIVGTYCRQSRHDGLAAGEAGADYVSFGPVSETALGDGALADRDLFAWWSEMIEVPVVAEGGVDAARAADLAPCTDFLGVGDGLWTAPDPVAALQDIDRARRG